MRGALLVIATSLFGCALPDEIKPGEFPFEDHVWSVSLYEGMWRLEASSPDGTIEYGSAAGTVLHVHSRDGIALTRDDRDASKVVAAAYCAKRGMTFDVTHNGVFHSFSKIWEFNGACSP